MRKLLVALCVFISGCCCQHQCRESSRSSWEDELSRSRERFGARALEAYWDLLGEGLTEPGAELGGAAPPGGWTKLRDRKAFLYKMQVHANNLMNACTVAFKRSRVVFSNGEVSGVTALGERIFEQGNLRYTGRDLDMAIDGEGFLRVSTPSNEVAFTRAGNLNVDCQGNLVTMEGYMLDPSITIPQEMVRVVIDQSGLVQGFDPQRPETLTAIGQIEITRFVDPSGLEVLGGNLYRETPSAGNRIDGLPGAAGGLIRQGYLEESNVNIEDEAIELRRALELYKLLGLVPEVPARAEAKGE